MGQRHQGSRHQGAVAHVDQPNHGIDVKPGLLNNRDVLAGALFVALGGLGLGVALAYPFGSTSQMGPGYFPRVLGAALMALGAVTLVRGLRKGVPVAGAWGWAPLATLVAALIAFGWLMERTGLLPALAALVITSAWAGKEFRWAEVLLLTVAMCLLALAIFVWGLGLPYPLLAFDFGR